MRVPPKLRWIALAAVLSAVAAFVLLGGPSWLSVAHLRDAHAELASWRAQHPVVSVALYFALYVAVASLSIPGAAVLTLAGGAMFGQWLGTLLVSTAATLGAVLAMWLARYVGREALRQRFAGRMAEVDAGMARDGVWYLLTLRLTPLVPFVVVNALMGLTGIGTRTFALVSWLGMLPATALYVNAGTQLAQVRSMGDVMSPALLGSLVLLGVFPLAVKLLLNARQACQRNAAWLSQKPKRFDRNLVVIGAGAGGLVASYMAAALKAKVTLIEGGAMGGDCLNTGCVPSKALIHMANQVHGLRHAHEAGWLRGHAQVDGQQVVQRIQQTIAAVAPHDSAERYRSLGVDVVQGWARLVNPWTVAIRRADGAEQQLTTRGIVLATGAQPVLPAVPGLAEVDTLTSDTLWQHLATCDALPQRWLVLGGGPIGCELAQALARLGAQVTLVERGPRLLPREASWASQVLLDALRRDGVDVRLGAQVARFARLDGVKRACLAEPDVGDVGDDEPTIEFDACLCALGRRARTEGLGLEALGIETDATGRFLAVNDHLQTRWPHILAVGDAAGPWQFTHVAGSQGWVAAVNALVQPWWRLRNPAGAAAPVPRVTYTSPQVASVGLTADAVRDQGLAHEVTRHDLADLDRSIVERLGEPPVDAATLEAVTEPGSGRVLGVTIVGQQAEVLVGEWVQVLARRGRIQDLMQPMRAYPGWLDANKLTAGQWQRERAAGRALRWLERWWAWRRG